MICESCSLPAHVIHLSIYTCIFFINIFFLFLFIFCYIIILLGLNYIREVIGICKNYFLCFYVCIFWFFHPQFHRDIYRAKYSDIPKTFWFFNTMANLGDVRMQMVNDWLLLTSIEKTTSCSKKSETFLYYTLQVHDI